MIVTHKTEYALRAVFELAKRFGSGPAKIAEVADKQAIPPRFLETILGQLKRAGFLESRRGAEGGYHLIRRPEFLSVGEVIRQMQGDPFPVDCAGGPGQRCRLHADCVFLPMWREVKEAITRVYDRTTFQDLLEEEENRSRQYVPSYSI